MTVILRSDLMRLTLEPYDHLNLYILCFMLQLFNYVPMNSKPIGHTARDREFLRTRGPLKKRIESPNLKYI